MSAWEGDGKSDEWYTPQSVFDALNCEFDCDVAASGSKYECVPRDLMITHHSLEIEWKGFVWMNPPFGKRNGVQPWLEKFFAHGSGIALTPDRTSAPWFEYAWSKADRVLFTHEKIKFIRPDGTVGKQPGCGTALWSSGIRGIQAMVHARDMGFGSLAVPMRGVR